MDDHSVRCQEAMCRHRIYNAEGMVRWLREVHPEEEKEKVAACERQYCQDYRQQYHNSSCVDAQWTDLEPLLSASSLLTLLASTISIDVQYVYLQHTSIDYWNMDRISEENSNPSPCRHSRCRRRQQLARALSSADAGAAEGGIRQLVLHMERKVAKRCEELCSEPVIFHVTKCTLNMEPESWIVTISLDGYLVAPSTCAPSLLRSSKLGVENSFDDYPWMEYATIHISFAERRMYESNLKLRYQQYRCFQAIHDHVRNMMKWKFSKSRNRYLSVETERLLENVTHCLDALQWCGRYLVDSATDFIAAYRTTSQLATRLLRHLPTDHTVVKLEPVVHRLNQCAVIFKEPGESGYNSGKVQFDFTPACCQAPPTAEQLIAILDKNIENSAADPDVSHRTGYSTMTHQLLLYDIPEFLDLLFGWVNSYASHDLHQKQLVSHTKDTWRKICDAAQMQESSIVEDSASEDFLLRWRHRDEQRWSEQPTASGGSYHLSPFSCEDLAERGVQTFSADCAGERDCGERAERYRTTLLAKCRLQKDRPVLPPPGTPDDPGALRYLAGYDC